MTQTDSTSDEVYRAEEIRDVLADKLCADGMVTSAALEAALRKVPRHAFMPAGTSLEEAYALDCAPPVKRDEHGATISSISAAFIQARMIEQAWLRPGARVLEIGSGGCNAALLSEVVGRDGRVVSMDIDPEITARASQLLAATGYGDRVQVMVGDGEHGAAEHAPFEAIIVTVGAWDIPPAWWQQLTDEGRLVVPLRMNGITRSIAFRRQADHLVSTSAEVCGFVPMQGVGEHRERVFPLADPEGRRVQLRFDTGMPQEPHLLDGVLTTERAEVWSGVTFPHQTSFADLFLWFACFLPGFCRVIADEGVELVAEPVRRFSFGAVHGDSLAYLTMRPLPDDAGVEFGAHAYGPHRDQAATAMVKQIQAWHRQARSGPSPTFAYWPAGSDRSPLPADAAVLQKTHGLVTISWPGSEMQRMTQRQQIGMGES